MVGLFDHVWGVSPAQDRVWAQVSGLAPTKAGKRLFVVLQAYIDDSYNRDGVFVLGGHIASAKAWADFSKEWEELLPFAPLNKHHRRQFKMSEMAASPDRMLYLPPFYRAIENHVLASLSCKIDISELARVRARVQVPGARIDWDFFTNPYLVAMRCLLDKFHSVREDMSLAIPLTEKVDFYFDNQQEKKVILSGWDSYLRSRPDEYLKYYGATPRFEDDEDFLPLQAADFWAWWIRKWSETGVLDEQLESPNFGAFQAAREEHPKIHIEYNEEELVKIAIRMIEDQVEPGRLILDQKHSSGE